MSISERALQVLIDSDIKWRFGDERRTPTLDEVEEALDAMAYTVYNGGEGVVAVTGGLLMEKSGEHLDVYCYLGDLNDDD